MQGDRTIVSTYSTYEEVPKFRRPEAVSRFLWVATACGLLFQVLGLLVTTPFVVYLAFLLFSGDVYYNQVDAEGKLKRWSFANKLAVVFLLVLHVWLFWPLYWRGA